MSFILLQSVCCCNIDVVAGALCEQDFVEDLLRHSVLKIFTFFEKIFSFQTGSGYSVIIL